MTFCPRLLNFCLGNGSAGGFGYSLIAKVLGHTNDRFQFMRNEPRRTLLFCPRLFAASLRGSTRAFFQMWTLA